MPRGSEGPREGAELHAFISLFISHRKRDCTVLLFASTVLLTLSYTRAKMRGTPMKMVGLSSPMSSISSLMLPWK